MSAHWQQISVTLSRPQISHLLNELSHSVYLESGTDTHGRYDILTAAPAEIDKQSYANIMQAIPLEYRELPFVCGEIGFVSYDWGKRQLISVDKEYCETEISTNNFPDSFSAYYTWSYVYDHKLKRGHITFSANCKQDLRAKILELVETSKSACIINSCVKVSSWKASQSFETYKAHFQKVIDYIYAGDCYQVNLAQRFEARIESGNITDFYFQTREETNTHYACLLSFSKNNTLMSFSPEQFISIKDRKITTRPIKGTLANKTDLDANILVSSEKNKAENLMIVDLLRNDLSKVCKIHSVRTTDLFKLETYKNVYHLVSTIEGELKDGISEKEAFLTSFPGGSITGAPKKRAMEIIEELEVYSRSAYCGSVYYLGDDGKFDSNILIRSIVHSGDNLYCWGGGGIVADSDLYEEYEESITKVRNLFADLEL